ncbi:hypothetical protein K435DRAFT_862090 [Dendrothele bispora CBS 962.96]|uniref:Uncharacterized protein n=1 Tax=Dendrothele bispora (strain CBS 962.96) TaxID=1314807 RepID=A0A4S8LTK0_DENBC|nr:hypothetical protein K435DRAFT_862090 [Dendrothele bispora CBS 962.96]
MSTSSTSGTQSPPLEATGEHKPMGASSVASAGANIDVVPDVEQRKQYFEQGESQTSTKPAGGNVQKMGESLADKTEKRD